MTTFPTRFTTHVTTRAVAIAALAASFGMALGHHEAAAQSARVYVDDGYGGTSVRGARVYGYARRADEPEYRLYEPVPPRSCGEFRYWNGEFCADARVTPPDVGPQQ